MTKQPIPLVVRRNIPAPRSLVFNAFSRADHMSRWFTPSADISVEVLEFDFVLNGAFRLSYAMPDGRSPIVRGTFERIKRPQCIVMSWMWEAPNSLENIPMRISFEFFEKTDASEVVITHQGIPSDAACTIHVAGWEGTLKNLEKLFQEETDQ